jgi:hypothetical protein
VPKLCRCAGTFTPIRAATRSAATANPGTLLVKARNAASIRHRPRGAPPTGGHQAGLLHRHRLRHPRRTDDSRGICTTGVRPHSCTSRVDATQNRSPACTNGVKPRSCESAARLWLGFSRPRALTRSTATANPTTLLVKAGNAASSRHRQRGAPPRLAATPTPRPPPAPAPAPPPAHDTASGTRAAPKTPAASARPGQHPPRNRHTPAHRCPTDARRDPPPLQSAR